jgi:hypothetical protein
MTRLLDDPTRRRLDRAAPFVVIALAMAVYVVTLLPGQAFDDWGEMQTVPHVLGVSHPTGYPTYILTAWAFELLPVGSIAWRANLLSAVCVATALGTLTAIGARLACRPWLAALGALATGAVATVWTSALVAEVNPLHLLLIALLVHRSLVWAAEGRLRDLALGGLLVGLSLGNHLLTVFVAPWFVAYALWAGRSRLRARPVWLLAPVATGVFGAAVYLYLPIAAAAHPPLVYNDPVTVDAIWTLVSGEQFRSQMGGLFSTDGVGVLAASLGDLVRLSATRATPVFPIVALIGLLALVRRRPAFGLACWGALVTGMGVWANYQRLEHYLLVPWLLLGIGVAVALDAGANAIARVLAAGPLAARVPARPAARVPVLVAGVVGVALVAGLVAGNLRSADRSHDRTATAYVDTVVDALPPNAAILSYWGASTPLWYARLVEGRRPDVLVVDDTNIVYDGWGTRERRIEALICERPVFMIRPVESDLGPTREAFGLTRVLDVRVGRGTPVAVQNAALYRVEPKPGRCP